MKYLMCRKQDLLLKDSHKEKVATTPKPLHMFLNIMTSIMCFNLELPQIDVKLFFSD